MLGCLQKCAVSNHNNNVECFSQLLTLVKSSNDLSIRIIPLTSSVAYNCIYVLSDMLTQHTLAATLGSELSPSTIA